MVWDCKHVLGREAESESSALFLENNPHCYATKRCFKEKMRVSGAGFLVIFSLANTPCFATLGNKGRHLLETGLMPSVSTNFYRTGWSCFSSCSSSTRSSSPWGFVLLNAEVTNLFKDIGSVPFHKNWFTHRVWGEVRNRVDKKYLVWASFSSRGIDLKKCSSFFNVQIKKVGMGLNLYL